jgi:hypothetical protein
LDCVNIAFSLLGLSIFIFRSHSGPPEVAIFVGSLLAEGFIPFLFCIHLLFLPTSSIPDEDFQLRLRLSANDPVLTKIAQE